MDSFGEEDEEENPPPKDEDSIFKAPPGDMRLDSSGTLVDKDGNPVAWDDTRSWTSFAKALVYYFILSLMIGLFGFNIA